MAAGKAGANADGWSSLVSQGCTLVRSLAELTGVTSAAGDPAASLLFMYEFDSAGDVR